METTSAAIGKSLNFVLTLDKSGRPSLRKSITDGYFPQSLQFNDVKSLAV